MRCARKYPRVVVTAKGARRADGGHPWVYESDVLRVEGAPENGATVDVVSEKGKYLGTGFLSEQSKIRARLVSRNANDALDEAFWRRRIRWAWDYRKAVMGGDVSCCRVIFGESDGFPGLTVDRFGDRMAFLRADVFDLLPRLEEQGRKAFDFIILDPPAFTKSRGTAESAERGYKEINLRAMRLLPRGGYLATCSCSHFMPAALREGAPRRRPRSEGRAAPDRGAPAVAGSTARRTRWAGCPRRSTPCRAGAPISTRASQNASGAMKLLHN